MDTMRNQAATVGGALSFVLCLLAFHPEIGAQEDVTQDAVFVVAEIRDTPSRPVLVVSDDPGWTEEEFVVARLAANEAGLFNPRHPDDRDVYAIAQTVKRLARWKRLSIPEYVARYHRRHLDPARWSNRWVLGLTPTTDKPPQWTPADGRWEGTDRWAYSQRWLRRLQQAREALESNTPACSLPPVTWGGPQVDSERLASMTHPETGEYVVTDCGPTHNVFLARRRDAR